MTGAGRTPLPRRVFLARLVQALASWPLLAARPARAVPVPPVLAVVPADAEAAAAWRRGLELGTEEAEHTARLLGRALAVRIAPAPASESAARAASALLCALDPAESGALAAHAAAAQLPLLVLRSGEPGEAQRLGAPAFFVASSLERRLEALSGLLVREEGRRRWALGTAPEGDGEALRAAAATTLAAHGGSLLAHHALDASAGDPLRPLLGEQPDVLLLAVPEAALPALLAAARSHAPAARVATLHAPASGGDGGPVFACDWHGDLERYGAAQLHERFARRFGAAMDERAWSAWLAVKLASEAQLRGGSEDRIARIAAARTDGHAGAPLRFRPDDRHLDTAVHVVGPPRDEPRGRARILATLAPGEEG